ncbi:hypothetical protein NE237_019457 [Protea cynaroides]|uniref:Wax synthase domain-containing protein n=1 Tax=Protea cynaroides TaxID=273540 RepID=A0A9Q0KBQ1_9MAGN|nr:hypothetical protein NE237_019457 [Protea cynaroides]
MEGEFTNIIKVWVSVFASLSYCYLIARRIPKGKLRLLSLIPNFCLFFIVPLKFSSFHLRGFTALFLAWLANFKLLLFAFGQGPLSLDPPMPLIPFIFVASLPIKTKNQSPTPIDSSKDNPSPLSTLMNYAIKVILLAVVIRSYDYEQYFHPRILGFLYCCHIYFCVEITLATVAYMARLILGLELEPTFKEPYLSTSLQDFWSRRWNLMVPKILHPTVYEPTRCLATHLLGNESESVPRILAILNTFLVSGLMHELLFFYIGCWHPTWKTMFYFVLHGSCLAAEIAAKKALANRWQLHPAVSCLLVNGFLVVTVSWLLLSEFVRYLLVTHGISEFKALVGFI